MSDGERDLLRLFEEASAATDADGARNLRAIEARLAAPPVGIPVAVKIAAAVVAVGAVTAIVAHAVRSDAGGARVGQRTTRGIGPSGAAQPPAIATRGCTISSPPAVVPDAPWRAHPRTVPADRFAEGVGGYVNPHAFESADPAPVLEALARAGARGLHFDVGWDHLTYDERAIDPGALDRIRALVRPAARLGLRPTARLISLAASPCPMQRSRRRVMQAARAGTRTLTLDSTEDITPGRTGLREVTRPIAAEILFVAVDGSRVTLSKPLPHDLAAGTEVRIHHLKYAPFHRPGTAEFERTLEGWLRFVDVTADAMTELLGSGGAADRGFDLELWNSVHWASDFLFIGRYHDAPSPGDEAAVVRALVERTAAHLRKDPQRFAGVRLVNALHPPGTEGTCAGQPPGVAGIRRPTPGNFGRPLIETETGAIVPIADGPPPDGRARIAFPEIEATDLVRDGVLGDLAGAERTGCRLWLTGPGFDPRVLAPDSSVRDALRLKAKIVLRQHSFFLNKGAGRIALGVFPRSEDDARGTGLLDVPGASVSVLEAIARLVRLTTAGAAPLAGPPRALALDALADCHGNRQPGLHGPLNRDLFAFLPFQVSPHRFAVHYYVVTRDVAADLPPEPYTLTIGGVNGQQVRVSAADALQATDVGVRVVERREDAVVVEVQATDTPRVLVLDESARDSQ